MTDAQSVLNNVAQQSAQAAQSNTVIDNLAKINAENQTQAQVQRELVRPTMDNENANAEATALS